MTDVNIKIPGLDQLAEIAKDLLQKVIIPPLEEAGLLLADKVKLFRFKNQVEIITKAESYLEKKNIKTKKVSLKVMAPLLEQCSLEEDESLKDKWAALFVNTVKDGSDINNALFSYILSQLSPDDARLLKLVFEASVQTHHSGPATVWVHQNAIISMSVVKKEDPEANLSIDNLIRLRLIKETSSSISDSPVIITTLGVKFFINCTLP